jgi:hypothetical protein
MKKIINCETSEVVERELNEDELSQQVEDEKTLEAAKKQESDKAALRQNILERLGLTEEEAGLLLK